MGKNIISEELQDRILEEIQTMEADRPWALAGYFAEASDEEYPQEFIEECKREIKKNKAFQDKDVIDWLSGFDISELLGFKNK
jgi:hypothetical protein